MAKDFEVVGVAELSSTKRSVRLILNNMPDTTFTRYIYISCKTLLEVINGHKKTATIYKPKQQ